MSDTATHCPACGHAVSADVASCGACGAPLPPDQPRGTSFTRLQAALAQRYSVERPLGHGGMANVYLAHDRRHDRLVALKVLKPEVAAGLGPERFLREIQVAAHLQHPHILPLLDSGSFEWGQGPPGLYYVMPYAKDESLRERLRRETQLAIPEAVRITCEVAEALHYAHGEGLVHRDIKPENILLWGGHALVSDFGIARAIHTSASESLTASGVVVGTPSYMSPEQAAGGAAVSHRSDIYSLGCVLYEMLAGEPPFTGPSAQIIIAKRLSEPVPRIHTVRENVPDPLERVIHRALEKVPADRFATAAEMVEALTHLDSEAVVGAAPPAQAAAGTRPGAVAPRGVLVTAGLVAAALLAGSLVWRSPGGRTPRLSPTRVAVLPFSGHGGEESHRLAGAIVTLLSAALDGVGDLRTIDPSTVLAATGEDGNRGLDPRHARQLAARLGAGRYIVGGVVEAADGRVTISATAQDVSSDQAQGPRVTVEGSDPGQVFRLVNELTVQLLQAFDIPEAPPRLESISTGSTLALNEYLKGESALRRGDHAEAVRAFGRAVAADTLFALAWFRQSYALVFTESAAKAEQSLRRALALRDRLSERDRRLAEAFSATLRVDPVRADRLYRAFVYEYPDDVEGWFGRADLTLHFGPLYGLAMDSLSQGFERVLALDPRHAEAWVHLPWAAGLDGRLALLDSATSRVLLTDSGGYYAPVFRILRAFARGDSAAEAQAVAAGGSMDDLQRLLTVNLSATLQDPARTLQLARRLFTDGSRLPEVRAFGHLLAASLELARGRTRSAQLELAAADTLEPSSALEHRALLLLHPLVEPPESVIVAVRSRLERWDPAATPQSISADPWVVPHDSLHPQLRLHLLGLLSARPGAPGPARRYASELLRFDSTTSQGVIGRALGHEVLAHAAVAQGNVLEGLAELDSSALRGPQSRVWERAYSSPFFSQAQSRYLRARLLAGLDRDSEALRSYRSLWMANAFDLAYLAPSHLGQAELYDRRGDRDQAVQHYRAFIDLWSDADPEGHGAVRKAEKRLAELGG